MARAFPHPANTGLGDRLGQYAQLATIGRLLNVTVVTRWTGGRCGAASTPSTYATFSTPDELRLDGDGGRRAGTQRSTTGASFRPGFDLVPEASHRYLTRDGVLPRATPRESYAAAYRHVAASFRATARVHDNIPNTLRRRPPAPRRSRRRRGAAR